MTVITEELIHEMATVIETAPFGLERNHSKEMTRLWRALAGFAIVKDILVYSHEEVER